MVKVTRITLNHQNKTAEVSLFADTKAEMSGTPDIQGLPSDYTIEMGSSVITASGQVAFMKSDGTWNWV